MRRLLIALIVAGAALRFATLDVQSFWYDEAFTVGIVHMDFGGMLGEIPRTESTPPLYYILAWVWTRVFGDGEIGIRSLSALLGSAAIPVFYLAARELTRSERAAVGVAALAAFNPLLVWYSQEARTYALLALLGGLSLYFFARSLREDERAALIGWAVTSALALTAHYFAGFLVVPEAVWLFLRAPRRPVAIAVGAVAAAGLALLPLAIHQQRLDLASFIKSTSLAGRLLRSPKQFLVGFDAPLEVVLTVVAGAIVLAGMVVALRRPEPGVRAAAVLGALGLVLPAILALLGLDYVDTRNLIVAWLPLLTLACAGLARNRAGQAGIAAVCGIGLAGVIGVAVTPLWQRDNWRGVVEALGPPRADRVVVLTPTETGVVPFRLYDRNASPLPAAGATVGEIALVSKPGRNDDAIHPARPPRPARPVLPGFNEVRRVYADNFTVIVFARRHPVHMTPGAFAAYRLLPKETAGLLLDRPVSAGEARGHRRRGG